MGRWIETTDFATVPGMVHHNLVVKGPLFPLFPEGWEGPQAGKTLEMKVSRFLEGMLPQLILGSEALS